MTLSFMNNKGYIFIVRRLGKQSKLILSRLDSISNLKLNLRIHGQCGPYAHAGADLQAFLIFCFKPILISAHKLTLLIYGDNTVTTMLQPMSCQNLAPIEQRSLRESLFMSYITLQSTLPPQWKSIQFRKKPVERS